MTATTATSGPWDHLSYQDVIDTFNNRSKSYVRADVLTDAEKQAAFETQRYSRQRYRDIYVPRRDAMRGIFQHKVAGMSVAFNTATNLTQLLFNAKNPMTLMSNAFKLAISTFSEIRGHLRKGKYVHEDAKAMQNIIWDHVYNDVLPILMKRPIKADGTVMEIPEVRGQLIGVLNDDYVLQPRCEPTDKGVQQVNMETRAKIARLLDCQLDTRTGKIIANEDTKEFKGTRFLATPVNLPPLPAGQSPAPTTAQ